ncbi:MAG: hypothetical protein JKY42_05870 [Flavobacteriales bacterium]|nr:hypothetical protein [Flavobacteriales bacterium]
MRLLFTIFAIGVLGPAVSQEVVTKKYSDSTFVNCWDSLFTSSDDTSSIGS